MWNVLRSVCVRGVLRGCGGPGPQRSLADMPAGGSRTPNQLTAPASGNEGEHRVRVRRVRPGDVPRVLRFVREHARPAELQPAAAMTHAGNVVLCDHVSRALAQGHSMLAEHSGTRRGWSSVRGVALSAALVPWDAALLERWSRCVRGPRSRRMLYMAAHYLRAPALHDKYHVHSILQVLVLVPPDATGNEEVVQQLATGAVKRALEAGFPLVRFDTTSEQIAKQLEHLGMRKECQVSCDVPEVSHAGGAAEDGGGAAGTPLTVYTSTPAPTHRRTLTVRRPSHTSTETYK